MSSMPTPPSTRSKRPAKRPSLAESIANENKVYASAQAKEASSRSRITAPTAKKAPAPQRPVRPESLKKIGLPEIMPMPRIRPQDKKTADVVWTDDELEGGADNDPIITKRLSRHLYHLAEFGRCSFATLVDAVYPPNATTEQKEKISDSTRKGIAKLVKHHLIRKIDGRGRNATYVITPKGMYHYGSYIDPDLKAEVAEDESLVLCRSRLGIQLMNPQPESFFYPVEPGELAPGLPVLSHKRIAYEGREMAKGKQHMSEQQAIDAELFLTESFANEIGYPVVDQKDWGVDKMTPDVSRQIMNVMKQGWRDPSTGERVLPSYLWNTYDSNSSPLNLAHGVIPLPHVRVQTSKRKSFLLSGSVIYRVGLMPQDDNFTKAWMMRLARNAVGMTAIVVFARAGDGDETDGKKRNTKSEKGEKSIGAIEHSIERCWNKLVDHNMIPDDRTHLLEIIPFEPLNSGQTGFDYWTPDKMGQQTKHYGRG